MKMYSYQNYALFISLLFIKTKSIMKFTLKIILIFLVLFAAFSCKQNNPNAGDFDQKTTGNTNVIEKEIKHYGLLFNERDSISVDLNLDDYKTYEELLDRVHQIGCTDRIPKITLGGDEEIRKIYFISRCDEKAKAPVIKLKNVIQVYEDKVYTYFDNLYDPLDSLKSITARNIKNYGKIGTLSDSPDKLIFSIAYGLDANPNRLKNTLLQLTKAFDEVGGKNNLRIILDEGMEIAPPPPPPPPAPDIIEVVEDELEIEETVISNLEIYEDEEIVEVIEVDNTTSTKTAASTFNSLTNYMVIPGTSTSSIYLNETSTGRYKIIMTVKVNNYIENGVNNGTATIKATVPLDKVDDLYIEDDIIFLESNDDNFYIVAGFAGKEESHYTDYFEIQVKNKSKRDRIYKAIKTLIE